MKTKTAFGETYTIPDIECIGATEDGMPIMKITEGEFTGVEFSVSNTMMSDDGLDLTYNLETTHASVDQIKPIADNMLLILLLEAAERQKEANETDTPSPTDT
jgi:hypothetical protein